jgi:hypothetical protein
MPKIRPSLHESFPQSKQAPPNPVAPLAASTLIILFGKMLNFYFYFYFFNFPSKNKKFVKEN